MCKIVLLRVGEGRQHVDAVPVLAGGGGPFVDVGCEGHVAPRAVGAVDHVVVAGPGGGGDGVGHQVRIVLGEKRVADVTLAAAERQDAHGSRARHAGMRDPHADACLEEHADGRAADDAAFHAETFHAAGHQAAAGAVERAARWTSTRWHLSSLSPCPLPRKVRPEIARPRKR